MLNIKSRLFFVAVVFLFCLHIIAFASTGKGLPQMHDFSLTLLWLGVILVAAKVSGLVEKFGQPSVLGELVIGVILGNLTLLGIHTFEQVKSDSIITFLSELGVIILLFQVGLDSNVERMKKVGVRALLVACVGVVVPFFLGTYLIGPWLMPNLSFNTYLFLGAALTATSIGITARVFQDLKKLHIPEAQIVLAAAVIDDILALIILAIVSAIATTGVVGVEFVGLVTAKAILFLIGAIVIGQFFAPRIGKLFSKIHNGIGMKFTLAISFCLVFSFTAKQIGLAPIVGAFAAGLILDPVHFCYFKDPKVIRDVKKAVNDFDQNAKDKISSVMKLHSDRHVEDLVAPIGLFFVPIFFVVTGMNVRLETMFNPHILLGALGLTVLAFFSKMATGLVAGKVDKFLVGVGMIPRGEVGLIFVMTGKTLNVISDEIFSTIVIMIILTTLLTPPLLTFLLKKYKGADR